LNSNLHWAFLETFLFPFQGNFGPLPTISTYSKALANGLKTYEYQNTTGNIQFAQQIFKLPAILALHQNFSNIIWSHPDPASTQMVT
jgi:hypothetical protein